jgi:hypothetical protein
MMYWLGVAYVIICMIAVIAPIFEKKRINI